MKISTYINKLAWIAPQLGLVIGAIVSFIITVKTESWIAWPICCSIFPVIGLAFQIISFEKNNKE